MKNFRIVLLGLLWIIPVSADERFIPLELFTGGEIRNDIRKLNIHQQIKFLVRREA